MANDLRKYKQKATAIEPGERYLSAAENIADETTVIARQIVAGKVEIGNGETIDPGSLVKAAAQRHLDDRERAWEYEFSPLRAYSVVEWIEAHATLSKGQFEGTAMVLNWWQRFVAGSLFGWLYKDGEFRDERRFRKAYLEQGKGSGKSPFLAAITLYMAVADGEARAECYLIGKTAIQARVGMEFVQAIVDQNPELEERLHLFGGAQLLQYDDQQTGSKIVRGSSESEGKGKSGPMPSLIFCDEYHEHLSSKTFDFYWAGVKHRRSPLAVITTNSGSDFNSACGVERVYAESIMKGESAADSYFAFICSLDEGDDPYEDESCWPKTNPSLPTIPGLRYIKDMVDESRGMPSKRSLVERLQFCVWAEAENPWIDRTAWLACETRDPPPDDVYSRPSYLAIDLSKTTDLSAMTLATDMDEYVYTKEFLWTPESTMAARGQRDKMDYVGWVRAGYLQTTPGPIIDYEALCLQIQELIDLYNIQAMCYDRWKIDELLAAAKRVNLELTKFSDRPGLLVMPHSQSFQRESKADNPDERPDQVIPLWMPKSIEATERLILQGKLKSAYNPLVRSAVLGAVVLEDGSENRKFAKDRSTRRIDPCVSKAMAIGLLEARKPVIVNIGSFIPGAGNTGAETYVRH